MNEKGFKNVGAACLCLMIFLARGVARADEAFHKIGLPKKWIAKIEVDPQNPAILYALSSSIYKSTDYGKTWNPLVLPGNIYWFAINPLNPSCLYASEYGFYISPDGGTTWQKQSDNISSPCAVDPIHPNVIFANGYQNGPSGIFRSLDCGATWSEVYKYASPGYYGYDEERLLRISIAPANPNVLYAEIGEYDNEHKGVKGPFYCLKTSDGGDHWTRILNRPCSNFCLDYYPEFMAAFDPFVGGLFVSTDQGANWQLDMAGFEGTSPFDLHSDPLHWGAMYAICTYGKLYWQQISKFAWQYIGQVGSKCIESMAIDNKNGFIYIGTDDGIWSDSPFAHFPLITISSPRSGATLFGTAPIRGNVEAREGTQKIEVFIDGQKKAELPGNHGSEQEFSWDWDTRPYEAGSHQIKVQVADMVSSTAEENITVQVQNLLIRLQAERVRDRAWLFRYSGIRLDVTVDNRGQVPGVVYTLSRSYYDTSNGHTGPESIVKTFSEKDLVNGRCTIMDKVPSIPDYKYALTAHTATGTLVGSATLIVD